MGAIYNDGSVNYGSITVTIGAVTYVADDFTVNRNAKIIKQTDELDEPAGSVGVSEFVEGSATLQYLTAYPVAGTSFPVTVDSVIGSESFRVVNVGNPLNKASIKMVPITFIKNYN